MRALTAIASHAYIDRFRRRFTTDTSAYTMMPRNIGAALLVAGLAALGYSTLVTGQQTEPTFVAVVRPDGSMIPIAAFDGREWWNRWPDASQEEGEVPPVPSTISSVPSDWLPPGMRLPAEWRLHVGNGRDVPVKALRPIRTSMLEQYVIGLQVDYTWKGVLDEPGGALAVSGPAMVGGFVRASPPEAGEIAEQLADRLVAIEQTEVARWVKDTERPSDTAQKLRRVFRDAEQKEPVALSLMRAERSLNGRTFYHLTGERLYVLGDAMDDCKMNMSFDGAVATDRNGRVAFENVSASAWAEYCGDAASRNDLIATIQVRDQLIWVGIENLEDGFSYFLIDPHTKQRLRLRHYPFVRVPLAFYDDGCSIADLCDTLDGIRSTVASRSFADLVPYISSKATEQIGNSRNLITELKDPRSVAWPALERLLTLGGRVRRWVGGPTVFCAPGIHAASASSDDAEAFRSGVELDSLWAIAVPFANVFESPRENSKVIATAGHELVAVTEAANWDAPNTDDSWVTLRWDRAHAYVRRAQPHGPNDPGVCLDFDSGSWRITYFRP